MLIMSLNYFFYDVIFFFLNSSDVELSIYIDPLILSFIHFFFGIIFPFCYFLREFFNLSNSSTKYFMNTIYVLISLTILKITGFGSLFFPCFMASLSS